MLEIQLSGENGRSHPLSLVREAEVGCDFVKQYLDRLS
jgi:hypothetical protein